MPPQNHVVRGETLVNGFIVKRDAEEPEITRVLVVSKVGGGGG